MLQPLDIITVSLYIGRNERSLDADARKVLRDSYPDVFPGIGAQPAARARDLRRGHRSIDIRTGELIDGNLSTRAADMVREWIGMHRSELLEMWETQEFKKLDPLD